MGKPEVLSQPNQPFRIARLFHRGGSKAVSAGADLLCQAISLLADGVAHPLLVAGAGLIGVSFPTPTRDRYPTPGEFSAMTDTARQAAEAVRASLPFPRPLIVFGLDVCVKCARSDNPQWSGQFAVILPGDGGPPRLLPKRFPTPAEWAYLRPPDNPPEPVCETPQGRAVALVCHDVNVYHPRGEATTSLASRVRWRTVLRSQILEMKPAFGLHLAHHVATAATFRQPYRVWKREVGAPLIGVCGFPAGISMDKARALAASLLTDPESLPTLDLCESAE
jgi:hypothetical protein